MNLFKVIKENALKVLKNNKCITGERGVFKINPEIFWKGDQKNRKDELVS